MLFKKICFCRNRSTKTADSPSASSSMEQILSELKQELLETKADLGSTKDSLNQTIRELDKEREIRILQMEAIRAISNEVHVKFSFSFIETLF